MGARWPNFSLDEFDCPCCGKNWAKPELLDQLQKLRTAYGQPIKIVSGYRCPEHNAAVGGVSNSQHIAGNAADLSGGDMDRLYELCETYFKAVGDGRSKGFIHVDRRADKVRRWNY